eukprot:TRINITY_DN2333_c0_g1_i1.p1 TRINITY_DN2333_c0_g1~~TRINITY_DN2333_c0_g1_i1.p1  ORF type:complete len:774 (-),score=171.28 TRINITY_DN2333_c0_g1_i1:84-2405(-)
MESVRLKGKDALLAWCQIQTSNYSPLVAIVDFQYSWQDGLAFCALLHSINSDYIPFHTLTPYSRRENLELAFKTAFSLGIPQLLDVDDILTDVPDANSIISYLTLYYKYFYVRSPSMRGLSMTPTQGSKVDHSQNLQSLYQSPIKEESGENVEPVASVEPLEPVEPLESVEPIEQFEPLDPYEQFEPLEPMEEEVKIINLCPVCQNPLCGEVVQANATIYHRECFHCQDCKKELSSGCLDVEGKLYCEECGNIQINNFEDEPEPPLISPRAPSLDHIVSTAPRLGGLNKGRPTAKAGRKPLTKKPNKEARLQLEEEYNKRQEQEQEKSKSALEALSNEKSDLPRPPRKNVVGVGVPNTMMADLLNHKLKPRNDGVDRMAFLDKIEKKKAHQNNNNTNAAIETPAPNEWQLKLKQMKEKKAAFSIPDQQLESPRSPQPSPKTNVNPNRNINNGQKTASNDDVKGDQGSPKVPLNALMSSSKSRESQAAKLSPSAANNIGGEGRPTVPERQSIDPAKRKTRQSIRLDRVISYKFEEHVKNMEGWFLKKDGGMLKSWVKRWIMVKPPGLLLSYSSPPNLASSHRQQVSEILSLHTIVTVQTTSARDAIFAITSTETTWFLQAESTQMMELWINFLNTKARIAKTKSRDENRISTRNAHGVEQPVPSKEGVLQKRELVGWWRPYYFQVQDGFMYFSKAKGAKQTGKIALYQCTIKENNTKRHPFAFKIISKNSEIVARASSEADMHEWISIISQHKSAMEKAIDAFETDVPIDKTKD